MKKRYLLFILLWLYIGKNYIEIVSDEPVNDHFWEKKLSYLSSPAPGTPAGDNKTKEDKMRVTEIVVPGQFVRVNQSRQEQSFQGMNSISSGDVITNTTGATEVLASLNGISSVSIPGVATEHGPSASAEVLHYDNPSTSSSVTVPPSQTTAAVASEPASPSLGSLSLQDFVPPAPGAYTTFDDDPDPDPGGPITPPTDVPLDGGLTLLLTSGIVSGVVRFHKSKQKKVAEDGEK